MPEKQIPATQSEPGAAPGEFDFANPATENPRIRRRSLKAKPGGLIKPSESVLSAARELEREAPPLSSEEIEPDRPQTEVAAAPKIEPAVKIRETPVAPPRTTAAIAATHSPSPASGTAVSPKTTAAATTASTSAAPSASTTSPHGTRPATLYYSSQPRKDKEAPSPMKTTPTAGPAPTSSSSAATLHTSAARPATASASPRPASPVDYRANVERQSREQKSVGNILSYAVYTLIGLFVIAGLLAGYGANVIFKQLHQQSVTVSDLDQRYAAANKDLNVKLAATQDTLAQAQAQIARQQELILKQQEDLNRLIAATNDNANGLKTERLARTQDTALLRERVKDLELRGNSQQKY